MYIKDLLEIVGSMTEGLLGSAYFMMLLRCFLAGALAELTVFLVLMVLKTFKK